MGKLLRSIGIAGCLLVVSLLNSVSAKAELKNEWFGWVNVDYGYGRDRYTAAQGFDQFGVGQYALGLKGQHDDVGFVMVFGGDAITAPRGFGAADLRDGFIVIKNLWLESLELSVGAQPLLFGLKPNGFPGDRSIQASVEFGGGSQFAVAGQAEKSVKFSYSVPEMLSLDLGVFDTDEVNAAQTDGSSLAKNFFVQLRSQSLGLAGLYGVLGYESRYEGGAVDASKPITAIGLGYKTETFDVSFERFGLDKAFAAAGVTSEESYLVAELTVSPLERWNFYFDWSRAERADVTTMSLGTTHKLHELLNLQAEISRDRFGKTDRDLESFNARLQAHF